MSDWSWSSSVTGIKSTLQWESLQERRARARVVIFHKIQYSLVAIPMTLFQHTPSTITTRGAPKKFVVPFCRIQAHKTPLSPLPLSSGTPCRQVSLLTQTLILSAGHSLWWDSAPSSPPPPPPPPPYLFLNRTALALFLSSFFQHYFPLFAPLFWRHEVATICQRHLTTIRTDTNTDTRFGARLVSQGSQGSQGTYRVYASFKRALKITYWVENYNHNMQL